MDNETYNVLHEEEEVGKRERPLFKERGKGFCGSIWAKDADTDVIKREDGGPGRSVVKDERMHMRILKTADGLPVRMTHSRGIINSSDDFWRKELGAFPASFCPCRAYRTERIPPMPRDVRERLIDRFCPPDLRDFVRSNRADEDCLVRLYLGRRRRSEASRSRFRRWSLRNYPLHVDQMEELQLDTHTYARCLADTLAQCFWRAEVDLNDVEFVLAPNAARLTESPSPQPADNAENMAQSRSVLSDNGERVFVEMSQPPATTRFQSEHLCEHVIWMLDYDCCKEMTMDLKGVEQAVHAFYRNDPYFPRPYGMTDADRELWDVFRRQFLDSSRLVLSGKLGMQECAPFAIPPLDSEEAIEEVAKNAINLPAVFIAKVEAEGKKRWEAKLKDQAAIETEN